MYTRMLADVARTRDVCAQAGFGSAAQRIGLIYQRLDVDKARSDSSYLAAELLNAYDAILEATVKHRFLRVRMARATCVDNPNLMGSEVLRAFKSARPDIVQAGNCLAADCDTAAVFHLMRVVEWGLRAFAVHLGVTRLQRRYKKTRQYIPVAYSEWEGILQKLQNQVDLRMQKRKRGSQKQADQEFYYPILQDIRGIRDAWRNHVMHARQEYSPQDADAIFSHVKRLMSALATRVTEV